MGTRINPRTRRRLGTFRPIGSARLHTIPGQVHGLAPQDFVQAIQILRPVSGVRLQLSQKLCKTVMVVARNAGGMGLWFISDGFSAAKRTRPELACAESVSAFSRLRRRFSFWRFLRASWRRC